MFQTLSRKELKSDALLNANDICASAVRHFRRQQMKAPLDWCWTSISYGLPRASFFLRWRQRVRWVKVFCAKLPPLTFVSVVVRVLCSLSKRKQWFSQVPQWFQTREQKVATELLASTSAEQLALPILFAKSVGMLSQ